MKKLLFTLCLFYFIVAAHAQQTVDDVNVGKSKTFGNYSEAFP